MYNSESIGSSGPLLAFGGGGPEDAEVVCPSIEMPFMMNSIKVNIFTIWGRIFWSKVIIFFNNKQKKHIINKLLTEK